ncbi:MAG TPA: hypothetical protein VF165_11320 [Nocardioidaceae bacterium]
MKKAHATVLVAALGLIGATAISGSTRATYGTTVWWEAPRRIQWCDRAYIQQGTHISRDRIQPGEATDGTPIPLTTVGRVPPRIGRPLLASVTPPQQRDFAQPPLPCAMGLYLWDGPDDYLVYSLSGGP